MDLLADMLAHMFKSDARTFHRRLGVLRCFRPENPTGTLLLFCPELISFPHPICSNISVRSRLVSQTDLHAPHHAVCSVHPTQYQVRLSHVILVLHIMSELCLHQL